MSKEVDPDAIAIQTIARWVCGVFMTLIVSVAGYYTVETYLSPDRCTENVMDITNRCFSTVSGDEEPQCMNKAAEMLRTCVEAKPRQD